jgi:hypothetical protein
MRFFSGWRTRICFGCLTLVLLSVCASTVWAQTELSNPNGGCAGGPKPGVCDKALFLKAFGDAKTVAIETRPKKDDLMGAGQVASELNAQGKTVQPDEATADLSFVLVHINTDGVFDGPSGTALATLRVYKGSPSAGALIWSETFSGQSDMTWPVAVRSLVQQFHGQLPKQKK